MAVDALTDVHFINIDGRATKSTTDSTTPNARAQADAAKGKMALTPIWQRYTLINTNDDR